MADEQPKMIPTLGLTGVTVNAMALIAPGAFLWITFVLQAGYVFPSGLAMWFGILVALSLAYATAISYAELAKLYPAPAVRTCSPNRHSWARPTRTGLLESPAPDTIRPVRHTRLPWRRPATARLKFQATWPSRMRTLSSLKNERDPQKGAGRNNAIALTVTPVRPKVGIIFGCSSAILFDPHQAL